jgi:hypothetical protein
MVQYAKSRRAQNMSFRKLVNWIKVGEVILPRKRLSLRSGRCDQPSVMNAFPR